MIKNYLTIAWRNLRKHTLFSFINIAGLAIGVAACMIIFIYVQHELTYDQYNSKYDRIARVTTTIRAPESDLVLANAPTPLAMALETECPHVESAACLNRAPHTIEVNGNYFREEDFFDVDRRFFSVFDLEFLEGSAQTALQHPNEIVLTETIAKKYFGERPALGKTVNCDGTATIITGVVKDRPGNSDIFITALKSRDFSTALNWNDDESDFVFVLLRKKIPLNILDPYLDQLVKKHAQPALDQAGAANYKIKFETQALKDVHFVKGKLDDTAKGDRQVSYVFAMLAFLILIIALLNYINLSTAKSAERAKEVGIRKVSGAQRFQLVRQFLFESLLIVSIAWVVAIGIVALSLPFLNKLLNTDLIINPTYLLAFSCVSFLFTFLIAGLYPSLVLSSFLPIKVLKGNWHRSVRGIWLRKVVTITQFAVTAGLIMATLVIYKQMKFIEKKDLGYNKSQLMNIYAPKDSAYQPAVAQLRSALESRPEVLGLTVGSGMVEDGMTVATTFAESAGKKREIMSNYLFIDPSFLSVFQIKLVAGRNLSKDFGTDLKQGFLVNEAFVKFMGWKSAIGKYISGMGHEGKVVGVVRNFSYKSLHKLVEPLALIYDDFPVNTISVRIQPGSLPAIKKIYDTYLRSKPLNYSFFDDTVSKQYSKDRLTMTLFTDFTILSILVSCLGLYGLVSLIAVQRTKEIGIRKVLGASLKQLASLLSRDFIKLLFLSLTLALPVIGLLSNRWLDSYAYHTYLTWWMFLIPAILLLLVLLVVISKEIIKTALINPIKSLRAE